MPGIKKKSFEPQRASARRRGFSCVIVLALSPALGACLLSKPDAALDVPDYYRAARGNPDAALPALDWWREFRSAELTALIEEAQTANLDIAAAVARIMQADAQARIAGAPLLPVVNLHGSAQRSQASLATGSGVSGGATRRRELYSAALTASYEIDFWGKNRETLRAAEETAVASRYDREVVVLSTIASVANAYFQVLAAQDRLRIARDNLASATRVLNLIKQRLEVGTASTLDTAQQESLVGTQRAAVPPLEQALRQNIATLAVLIGRSPERIALRGGTMSRLAIPRVTPGLPSDLLTRRPDIKEAEAQLAAAHANVNAARAAFFPSIQLTGEGGFQSALLRTLFTPAAGYYTIAASLTQPIFDGFRLLGQFELQKGKQEELLQTYRKAVISAFADVDKALVAVQQSAERERLQRQVVASSRRAFEISETRLREGAVDLITVLNTQQTLFQALDALAQARLARLQAIASLFQALGGGWPPQESGFYAWTGLLAPEPQPAATPQAPR
jgi:NodT family efflux transporter outer membrane factor (OMF) lipoprotein